MAKIKMTKIPFKGTAEQEKELRAILADLKEVPGALMPALQKAQGIYGYLPLEVQKIIAEELNTSVEEVFGVSTFYSQFSLVPKGEYKIGICLGTACYVKGSGEILEAFQRNLKIGTGECTEDGLFSLDATRCIGCCGLAPVLTVNDDVYGKVVPDDVPKILAKYQR